MKNKNPDDKTYKSNNKKKHFPISQIFLAITLLLFTACQNSTKDEEARLLLNHSNMPMQTGDSVSLQAYYDGSRNVADVTWRSDNTSVVTVTDNGRAEAVGTGSAVVTAIDGSGAKASCDISVKSIEAESIRLDKLKASVKAGKSVQLHADIYPEEASRSEVRWISEDDEIAIVNSSGLVTGKSAGIINIICRAYNGKEASCTVTVEEPGRAADIAPVSDGYNNDPNENSKANYNYTDVNEPFYGIWCGALKSRTDADKRADELRNQGLDAQVFVTTNWSNLNAEKWYVITAGVYESKEEAEGYLPVVKTVYSSAYVKYSGDWQG